MERPKDILTFEGISCMSFNQDFSQCCLSTKDKYLYIYKVNSFKDLQTWELLHTLKAHFEYISAVDWHPTTNKIISSSHDRNVYVWSINKSTGLWNPELVILKSKLSILCVKWSKNGDKFAAGSGGKQLYIGCYYDEHKYWRCEDYKSHKSAVTSVAFDNSGLFVISGSTDLRIEITSSYIEMIDSKR